MNWNSHVKLSRPDTQSFTERGDRKRAVNPLSSPSAILWISHKSLIKIYATTGWEGGWRKKKTDSPRESDVREETDRETRKSREEDDFWAASSQTLVRLFLPPDSHHFILLSSYHHPFIVPIPCLLFHRPPPPPFSDIYACIKISLRLEIWCYFRQPEQKVSFPEKKNFDEKQMFCTLEAAW